MWEPVLDGALASEVSQVVRDIADQMSRVAIGDHSPRDVALFRAYAAGAFDDEPAAAACASAVAELVGGLERYGSFHLHGGLAGAGFAIAHVASGCDEILAAIDREILGVLRARPRWDAHYDLVHGLVGAGVYFLERDGSELARTGLGLVIEHLLALVERDGSGWFWTTPVRELPPWQQPLHPNGAIDCGVAHGVPGAIAMLARAAAVEPRAADAAREALAWLRAQERSATARGRYPDLAGNTDTRTAWCYGDLGIAITAWGASARLGLDTRHWQALAVECAQRPFELTGVVDAGICHGAIGIAHLCNRMFQASGDPALADGVRRWVELGMAMRRPGEGIAGFCRPTADDDTWVACDDLLRGASGIGLALLATVHPYEPSWDRLLACDLPSRSGGALAAPQASP